MRSLRIELVLTAHPTEIVRRTLLQAYRRIGDLLAVRDRSDLTPEESRRRARRSPAGDRDDLADRGSARSGRFTARRSQERPGRFRADAVGSAPAVHAADRSRDR